MKQEMSETQSPIYYREIREAFDRAMDSCPENGYVARPKALNRYQTIKRQFVQGMRERNEQARSVLNLESARIIDQYGIGELEAKDLILSAWDTDSRLKNEGAVFGEMAFNFSLDRLIITKDEQKEINRVAENAVRALPSLDLLGLPKVPLNEVEQQFETLKLTPNAARVDIILTETGPKIIEINSQWVDAIGALAAFANVYGSSKQSVQIINALASAFEPNSSIAILDIAQTKGSRSTGATLELQRLAQRLEDTKKIRKCEVLDPKKTRLEYLKQFSSFYINCDPKFFINQKPDWVDLIADKLKRNPKAMFPAWRPMLDKKVVLPLLSEKLAEDSIAPTWQLSQMPPNPNTDVFVKGDGYSLNAVFSSLESDYQQRLKIAMEEPESYVCQPFLQGRCTSAWVYDTSIGKLKYIKDAYSKVNVWVINGVAVGTLITLNESPFISDKGYNAPPLVKGDKNG